MPDDSSDENPGDLSAMFDQINNLPVDDPLRSATSDASAATTPALAAVTGNSTPPPSQSRTAPPVTKTSRMLSLLPQKVLAAFQASGGMDSMSDGTAGSSAVLHAAAVVPQVQQRANGSVLVDAGRRVAVPSFTGDALRRVVETAAGLGLRVEPVGSGTAREQAPAAGTLVPLGTQVVVRFTR